MIGLCHCLRFAFMFGCLPGIFSGGSKSIVIQISSYANFSIVFGSDFRGDRSL